MELKDADETPIFNVSYFEQINSQKNQQKSGNHKEKNCSQKGDLKEQKQQNSQKSKRSFFPEIRSRYHPGPGRPAHHQKAKREKKAPIISGRSDAENKKKEDRESQTIDRLERARKVGVPFQNKKSKAGREDRLKNLGSKKSRKHKRHRGIGK